MGDYDRIIKENIEAILITLGKKLLGFEIRNSQPITEKFQTTIEREPDFLKKVILEDGSEIILHLEFQRNDESDMVYRMAEYKAIIQRRYQIPVRQYVIYLGTEKPKMKTELSSEEHIRGFILKNIHDIPVDEMLESEVPEEIVLSILTDYPESDADQIISRVINKLKKVAPDETALKKNLQQLVTLSRIRKLEEQTEKQIEAMPITYNIETDYLYNKGIEKGVEKNKYEVVFKALKTGKLSVEEIADLADVSLNYVLSVQSEIGKR